MVAQLAVSGFQLWNQKFLISFPTRRKPHTVVNKLVGIATFAGCKDRDIPAIMLNFHLEVRIVAMNISIKTKLDFDVPDSHQSSPDANNLTAGLNTSSCRKEIMFHISEW